MDICKNTTSYKHLENFIHQNLSSNVEVINEISMPMDINQLEHSLIPFIHKVSSNSVKVYNSDTNPYCVIDYDNSENEVIEIVDDDDDDDFVTDNTVISDKKEFNVISVSSENLLHNNVGKNNAPTLCKINGNYRNQGSEITKGNFFSTSGYYKKNNKFNKNTSKWKSCNANIKSFSHFKPQTNASVPYKIRTVSGKLRLLSQENDKTSKSDNCKFQNVTNGHVLKENNHSSLYQLKSNVKQQLHCQEQKFVSSSLFDNRTYVTQKRQQENSVYNESLKTAKQNLQENNCETDSSDSDEELMKVPAALLPSDHNKSFKPSSPTIIQHTSSKNHYTLSLDKILATRKLELERNISFKNQELASENDCADEECADTEFLQLIKDVNLNSSTVQRDRTVDLPPGLEIFDPGKFYHYFCPLHGLSLQNCGFIGEQGTVFDKKLVGLSTTVFQDMISLGVIKIHLDSTAFKGALLKYLFKFLSLHNNETVTYACRDVFLCYINSVKRSFCWYPSMSEVALIILNYGVNITNSCPVKDILVDVQKPLTHSKHSCLPDKKSCLDFTLVMDGFNRIIEIITLFLEHKHSHVYSQEEICDFILLLCWLSLDVRLLDKLVKIKIEHCIAKGLEKISASDWPDKMKYLAEHLAILGGHHRNILYVVLGLPVNERGIHLQRAVSYLAIQHLLEIENAYFVADVTPFVLLEFLKLRPLHHIKDYFLLHSVVSLLDLCVGNKVLPSYRNALQEMCTVAINTFGKIRETVQSLEETKVKDLLVRLYSKWNMLVRGLPHRKESIFMRSSSSTLCEASTELSRDVCEIKELEPE